MRKITFLIILPLFFLTITACFLTINQVFADESYAVCDLCGYCPPNNPPSNWEKCVDCLYPGASKNPGSKDTLKINPSDNSAPTPYPGRKYTVFGCINVAGGFKTEEGVVGVGQFFLNIFFSIIGGVAFLFLLYGGLTILLSQSNPEKLNYGKRVVYGAIIGLIFSFLSVFIVRILASNILRIPGFAGP